jgi:hypothetical protein
VIADHAGQQFGTFKPSLADLAVAKLAPISAEMARLMDDPAEIDRIIASGAVHPCRRVCLRGPQSWSVLDPEMADATSRRADRLSPAASFAGRAGSPGSKHGDTAIGMFPGSYRDATMPIATPGPTGHHRRARIWDPQDRRPPDDVDRALTGPRPSHRAPACWRSSSVG